MRDTPTRPEVLAGTAPRLSADGSWWWDGAHWQPATSPDGLWHWDGSRWTPSVDIDPDDTAAVAEVFDGMADHRFAAGGQLLAARHTEWEPQNDEVAGLVARAAPLARRLAELDAQRAAPGAGQSGLQALLGRQPDSDAERAQVDQELRPLAALLGRMAPQPSLPEADEMLASARLLEERALGLQKARAELIEREQEHRKRVEEATQDVAEAATAREAAVADIEAKVRAAEMEREQAVEDLTRALRGLRMPGPGSELARLQDAVIYANRIDTPDGRGPVDGAQVHVGSAAELWAKHRPVLTELLMLDSTGAGRFHESLAAEGDEGYALLVTRHVRSIVPFPPGDAEEAKEFARQVEEAARDSSAEHRRWQEQVRAAEEALEVAMGDSSRVDAARAELERAMADPELETPIREAERRLRAGERPPAALESARVKVREAAAELLRPPPPLRPAGA